MKLAMARELFQSADGQLDDDVLGVFQQVQVGRGLLARSLLLLAGLLLLVSQTLLLVGILLSSSLVAAAAAAYQLLVAAGLAAARPARRTLRLPATRCYV